MTAWAGRETKVVTVVSTEGMTREQIKAIIIALKGRRTDISDILVDILNAERDDRDD